MSRDSLCFSAILPSRQVKSGFQSSKRTAIDDSLSSVQAKYGSYHDVFSNLFQRAIESDPNKEQGLYVEAYDVVQGDYPTPETLSELNGILLTGSGQCHSECATWHAAIS